MLIRELIGWGSALVLLPTFGVQTYRQWHDRHEHASATSLWFFILAFVGTLGQFVYSRMVNNWVYLALNGCLVVNNAVGLGIAIRRSRIPAGAGAGEPARAPAHAS